jgi:hypothetical protein
MAFLKALQKTDPEDNAAYITALMEYKAECTAYYRARKLWKGSPVPMERLKWFEAVERYSLACKVFANVKEYRARAQAIKHFEAKGIDISGITLVQVAGIEVPMSMHEMMEQEAQRARAEQVENDLELRALRDAILANQNKDSDVEVESEKPISLIEHNPLTDDSDEF